MTEKPKATKEAIDNIFEILVYDKNFSDADTRLEALDWTPPKHDYE